MTEEIKSEPIAAPAPVEQPPTAPPEADDPSIVARKWLETASVEEIVKHPRFGGILGQRQQEMRERVRKELEAEQAEKARLQAEQELEKLANEDPVTFAERYLSEKERKRIADQQRELRSGVRKEFAEKIGKTFQTLAEWQELTPEEFNQLQQAVEGKDDEDAIGAFNIAALNIVAERKSAKKLADFRSKDLAKEREAIRAEEAAKLLERSPRPDIARGSQAPAPDPTRLSDKDFDQWYRQNMLGKI